MPDIRYAKEGTIILNFLDLNSGYLTWTGYAKAVVVEKENREKLIRQAVTRILGDFPPEKYTTPRVYGG